MWWYIAGWILSCAICFVLGLAVYRNNAKKFKQLEDQARASGKSIEKYLGL